MESVLLFVYGNLMYPEIVGSRLRAKGIRAKFRYANARLRGFRLFRSFVARKYNTVVPEKGAVAEGKLLEVVSESAEEVLRAFDGYEGCPGYYDRFKFLAGGRECHLYIFNLVHATQHLTEELRGMVERGEWKKLIREMEPLVESDFEWGDWYTT